MLIETHAHLYFDKFDEDRDDAIQRAFDADVKKIINIATDLETSKACLELAEKYNGLYATVGFHPTDAAKLTDASFEELRHLAAGEKVVAIGEIGLDFYWDTCPPDIQEAGFRRQINFAKEIGLPIVIHNREATPDILRILKSEGVEGLCGVFHCFSEDINIAAEILELGFYISFTGNLTFKKSKLPEVANEVPLDRLLLETDCPFLSPEPKRGRRNEPAHVVYIAQKLAEIKIVDLAEIENATTENAIRLFGLGEKATT